VSLFSDLSRQPVRYFNQLLPLVESLIASLAREKSHSLALPAGLLNHADYDAMIVSKDQALRAEIRSLANRLWKSVDLHKFSPPVAIAH
jgi:hypothetical protein